MEERMKGRREHGGLRVVPDDVLGSKSEIEECVHRGEISIARLREAVGGLITEEDFTEFVVELAERYAAELERVESQLTHTQEESQRIKDALDKLGIDTVSGVYVRRLLEPKIQKFINESKIDNQRSSNNIGFMVIMLDADNFKMINDTYGHIKGDRALFAIGQRLKQAEKRDGDGVFRYGGEEFTMVLPFEIKGENISDQMINDEVAATFLRIQNEINYRLILEEETEDENGKKEKVTIPITLSMGYTFFRKDITVKTPEELLQEADINMMNDKKNKEAKTARINKARIDAGLSPLTPRKLPIETGDKDDVARSPFE